MNLKIRLNSESHCDYWKTLAAQASYEPNRLAEIAENQLATVATLLRTTFSQPLRKHGFESHKCKPWMPLIIG